MKREEQARGGGAESPRSGRSEHGLPENLDPHLRRLHLATIRRLYREVILRAEKEQWSYYDFLALLIAEEVAHRQQTRLQRFSRKAHFPFLKTIEEFDFTLQSTLRLSLLGSALSPDFVTEGHNLVLEGRSGRGKTHLAVAIAYRAIQNGFEAFFTTAAALIDDLSRASRSGRLVEALDRYTHPHVLVIDEVGYLAYGTDAANVLFHVVNDRHLRRRSMIFTTNKDLKTWGRVLHDEDLADAIVDRILERGRHLKLDGPSVRTRHLGLDQPKPAESTHVARVSGNGWPEFPERTEDVPACKDGRAIQDEASGANSSACGGARAGATPGGVSAISRCRRMPRTISGSVSTAISRIGPSQRGQTRTSWANTRRRSADHRSFRGRPGCWSVAAGDAVVCAAAASDSRGGRSAASPERSRARLAKIP